MTSGLCNPEYYRGVVLEIWKFMEVREEGMEMQEEAACRKKLPWIKFRSSSMKAQVPIDSPVYEFYGKYDLD